MTEHDQNQPSTIEARTLDIVEHNTVAVLTGAPERLEDWRDTLAQALADTQQHSPHDLAEIAFFQAPGGPAGRRGGSTAAR